MNISQEQQRTARPLRVGLILDSAFLLDYSEIIRHILTGLADDCVPTAIVCPPGLGDDLTFNTHIERIVHPAYKLAILYRANRKILLGKLSEFKPTVLHCFSASQSKLTAYLAENLNIPYVVSLNSTKDKPYVSPKYCASLICSSGTVSSAFKQKHFKFSQRLETVNYATFVDDSTACFDNSDTLTSMIIVGRFDDSAKLEPTLNAIRHLAIDGYEFILFMIGSGRAEKKIRRLLRGIGLSSIVNIVPLIHPIREVLKEGDIFIQPVPADGFNPYMLEAMSVGMAVAGDVAGANEMLVKNETAAVFDSADELSIYSTIQQMFDKRELTRQMANKGQMNLRKNYSVSKMISSLIEIYQKASLWHQDAPSAAVHN